MNVGDRKEVLTSRGWDRATLVDWEEPNYAVFKLDTPLPNGQDEICIELPAPHLIRDIP